MTEEDLGLAHQLADIADGISGGYFTGGVVSAETKADGSPVTRVDREVELALRGVLERERPHEGFLGEEFGARGPAGRRWIVDAVDGTASFVAGEPEWSTLIALRVRGEVGVGLVSAPALGRRWYAAAGHGAWTERGLAEPPRRLAVSTTSALRAASVAIWPPVAALAAAVRRPAERLAAVAERVLPELGEGARKPSAGSGTCHGALLVAASLVDVFLLGGGGPWDLAALVPIVEEAGGRFSDLSGGRSLEGAAGLFSNGALHDQVLEIFVEHATRRED